MGGWDRWCAWLHHFYWNPKWYAIAPWFELFGNYISEHPVSQINGVFCNSQPSCLKGGVKCNNNLTRHKYLYLHVMIRFHHSYQTAQLSYKKNHDVMIKYLEHWLCTPISCLQIFNCSNSWISNSRRWRTFSRMFCKKVDTNTWHIQVLLQSPYIGAWCNHVMQFNNGLK